MRRLLHAVQYGFAPRYRPRLPVGRQGDTRFWRVGYVLATLCAYAPRFLSGQCSVVSG